MGFFDNMKRMTSWGKLEEIAHENGCKAVLLYNPAACCWVGQIVTMSNETLVSIVGDDFNSAANTLVSQARVMFKQRSRDMEFAREAAAEAEARAERDDDAL